MAFGPWRMGPHRGMGRDVRVAGNCVLVEMITCPFLGQILRNNTEEINYNFNGCRHKRRQMVLISMPLVHLRVRNADECAFIAASSH